MSKKKPRRRKQFVNEAHELLCCDLEEARAVLKLARDTYEPMSKALCDLELRLDETATYMAKTRGECLRLVQTLEELTPKETENDDAKESEYVKGYRAGVDDANQAWRETEEAESARTPL